MRQRRSPLLIASLVLGSIFVGATESPQAANCVPALHTPTQVKRFIAETTESQLLLTLKQLTSELGRDPESPFIHLIIGTDSKTLDAAIRPLIARDPQRRFFFQRISKINERMEAKKMDFELWMQIRRFEKQELVLLASNQELAHFLKLYSQQWRNLLQPLVSHIAEFSGHLIEWTESRTLKAQNPSMSSWLQTISHARQFHGDVSEIRRISSNPLILDSEVESKPKVHLIRNLSDEGLHPKRLAFLLLFHDWILSASAEELQADLRNRNGKFKEWFKVFRRDYDGIKSPGWWTFLSNPALRRIYAVQRIDLPNEVLQQLDLPRLPVFRRNIDKSKISEFHGWLMKMSPEERKRKILSQQGPTKQWFSSFRTNYPGTADSDRPGWWTFMSDDLLRLIYETGRIEFPAEAIQRISQEQK
ncbi:MAG TPA: hypothetical protein PLU50_01690 [Pseudobdellovibrionaceae bacterium]|nr:hypothetical protein [Pseudobdellovibrionaceae bacterium]